MVFFLNHYNIIISYLVFNFAHIFSKITTGKGIDRIYKHTQRNWTYPSPNTNFVIPHSPHTSIQNLRISACAASLGAHVLACTVSDKINIHHVNTDVNDNDDSLSTSRYSR